MRSATGAPAAGRAGPVPRAGSGRPAAEPRSWREECRRALPPSARAHLSEQEEKGAESLVLGGSAYLLPHCQVGEIGSDFGRAQEGGGAITVEGHEPPDPPRVRLLGPAAVVPLPDRLPEALNQGVG